MRERRNELFSKGLCDNCGKRRRIAPFRYCQKCKKSRSEYARQRLTAIRDAVLRIYGDSCACCGEKERAFLTIDHINNDGYKERGPKGQYFTSSEVICRRLVAKFRKDIQILCYNCNCAKQRLGYCPHKPCKPFKRKLKGWKRVEAAKLSTCQVSPSVLDSFALSKGRP